MSIDFMEKDITHKVMVKFVETHLPTAKKPYNLRCTHQMELDIHAIASKAAVYNIQTSPRVIEEGLTEAMKLMMYLLADGYKIITPLFNISVRLPGEYDGSETRLHDGLHPEPQIQSGAVLCNYLKDNVELEFIGKDQNNDLIAEAVDEATGLIDETATIGNLLTVHGRALKISHDEAHAAVTGLFFEPEDGSPPVKAQIIVINEPLTLKAIVPALEAGRRYRLKVVTQSSAKGSSSLLKDPRTIQSEFTLLAR